MKFELQEQLGKYPLLREIGSGATSSVYLARDPFINRDVAIKVFLFDKGTEAQSERMKHKAFVAEASLAGMLNHPHIVDILDAVVEPDHSYLVMEYVPGVTLEAHSDVSNLLPLSKVVEIIFKCVRALDYAFQHGVIHRDIKPGNILLSETGETKVGDFGASFQQRHETTQITGIGSPAYMSPEQIRMEPLNHQTDIYSLGVTMYRLLTGRLPYEAATQAALAYAILNTEPQRPIVLRPELPEVLDRIVMKAISKEPARRYASWLEFGKELTQAFTSLHIEGESANDASKFTRLRAMPFFQDFGDVALWEVIRIGSWKAIPAEEVVIREGDEGESFYLLIDGEVEITLEDSHLATLKPGACFGEMLYYSDRVTKRTSSVTAVTDITVIEMKSYALRAATDACQAGFNKAVIRVLIDKLDHSNLKLSGR